MSILHFDIDKLIDMESNEDIHPSLLRNYIKDVKEGVDLIFELKKKIDKFHPLARETLIRLLSN